MEAPYVTRGSEHPRCRVPFASFGETSLPWLGCFVHWSGCAWGLGFIQVRSCAKPVQEVAQHPNNHRIRAIRSKQGSDTFEHISTGHTVRPVLPRRWRGDPFRPDQPHAWLEAVRDARDLPPPAERSLLLVLPVKHTDVQAPVRAAHNMAQVAG